MEIADQLNDIKKWVGSTNKVVLARVIKTWGSSPRPVGSIMVINDEGNMSGSVSGGCVETSVVREALQIMGGQGSSVQNYGVSDEDAWTVGLSCGGKISVFLQHPDFSTGSVWSSWVDKLDNDLACVMVSQLGTGQSSDTLVVENGEVEGDSLPDVVLQEAKDVIRKGDSKVFEHEEATWFIHLFAKRGKLIVIGAAHVTAELVDLGNRFGFETIVIDPRGHFTQNTSFHSPPSSIYDSYPAEVLEKLSLDPFTYCAVLSHDPKIDDNALSVLLPSDVAYIGALGSRKTHAKRVERLKKAGHSDEVIQRINAPIGLSIGAQGAREIALSIMAKIIETKNLRSN